jgi:hypothetical protein
MVPATRLQDERVVGQQGKRVGLSGKELVLPPLISTWRGVAPLEFAVEYKRQEAEIQKLGWNEGLPMLVSAVFGVASALNRCTYNLTMTIEAFTYLRILGIHV